MYLRFSGKQLRRPWWDVADFVVKETAVKVRERWAGRAPGSGPRNSNNNNNNKFFFGSF